MKLKLNESLKSYDAFLSEKEAVEAAPATETSGRDAMIADVDHIITSLETLATAVTEMKEDWTKEWNSFEVNEENTIVLNENILAQWVKGKMLAKKQKKINVMKLKASDMATAAAQLQGAENRDKKTYITDKKKQLDDNVKELQAMVNDKAKEIGDVAARIVNKVKMQGQIDVIKSQIGNVDPKKAKDMKTRLADLQKKSAEEDEAIADFKAKADAQAEDEKGDDKVQSLKDQLAGLKDEKKAITGDTLQDKLDKVKLDIKIALLSAQIKAEDGDSNTDPSDDDAKAKELEAKAKELQAKIDAGEDEAPADEAPADEAPADEKPADEAPTDEAPADEKPADEKPADEAPADEKPADEKPADEAPSDEKPADKAPADEKPAKKANAEEPEDDDEKNKKQPKEALVIRANAAGLNELATEIDSKLDWQLAEGTGLRLKYEAAIRKAESDKTLNENRYFDNNVKDAFRRLL